MPLTKDEFLEDAAGGRQTDFVRHYASDRGSISSNMLWETYSSEAERITHLLGEISSAGADVRMRFPFSAIPELDFSRYDVIVLIAHWKAHEYIPSDFMDLHGLLDYLRRLDDQTAEIFLSESEGLWNVCQNPTADSAKSAALRVALAEKWNRICATVPLHRMLEPGLGDDYPRIDDDTFLNRVALDRIFGDYIVPGGRIEFPDALADPLDVGRSVSVDYTVLCDLAVCNSIWPGLVIKGIRPNTFQILNTEPATPLYRISILHKIIRWLSIEPFDYAEANKQIRIKMLKDAEQ